MRSARLDAELIYFPHRALLRLRSFVVGRMMSLPGDEMPGPTRSPR